MSRLTLAAPPSRAGGTLGERIGSVDWSRVAADLDARGYAVLPGLLGAGECEDLVSLYERGSPFRSRVVMAQHGFGSGEYKYFAYPLPPIVAELRRELYPPLARIANRWNEILGLDARYPDELATLLERCRAGGQDRPTPLLLRYEPGDHNCLHQDVYGEHLFPLQVAFPLSTPGRDFTGGELVLTEQRPRMQSRVEVVPLARGDGAVFPVRHRPVRGTRRCHRVNLRHGVSRVHTGRRHALGVVFHDSK